MNKKNAQTPGYLRDPRQCQMNPSPSRQLFLFILRIWVWPNSTLQNRFVE